LRARERGCNQLRHGLWLIVLTILGLTALPAAAAAQTNDTWTGAATSSAWSNATNWTAGVPPAAAGVLTFPTLTGCAAPKTCYTSKNGLSGNSVTGLVFSNTAGQYKLQGNALTVGASGITDNPGGRRGDVINAPLTLGAAQTWAIGKGTGSAYDSLSLTGAITGSSSALSLTFPASSGAATGDLFVDSNMEVGPVTVSGVGGLHIGGCPTCNAPGSVNGSDGNAVLIHAGAKLVANPRSTVGPLTVTGGKLLLGTNTTNTGATTLAANGAFSIDSASTTTTFINANGSTPGTDFSQLSATGNVSLAGQLVIGQGAAASGCVALTAGDVATLFTTTGTLSGTFSNAHQGAILTLSPSCASTAAKVQIDYTSNSVTATVVGATTATTTTLATPEPSPASTNQGVTLTATVATSTVAPAGTVAFSANGTAISGCTSQPVTASGSSGTATCTTSFAAAGSPESLTATFTGSAGSGQASSSSSPAQTLTVNKGSTTTTLGASNTSPTVGANVTYTATVTPGMSGASKPSGTVAFLDGGSPISSCTAQPLTAGASSSTATCTVSYPTPGSHTITAGYGSDANFTGSPSSATTVTVQPATTTTFPTTSVLDTFSLSAGPLSGNWQSPALQDASTVSIASSGQTVSSGGAASAIWKATTFGANQEAYMTVPVLPAAGDFCQVSGRISSLTGSTVSMYFLRVTPSKNLWDLRKKLKGGASTSMGTFTAPFAAGDSAGLQLDGSTITAWHESGTGSWTSVGSVTDTSITAGGYVSFTLGDATMRGGAFGGGTSS
jgi:Bacterial Ig-like domain (group 3)